MSYVICEERISLPDKLLWLMDDGRYLRLSSRRIGGLYLPVFRIAERENQLGRYTRRRNVRLCVHITTRYCARPGASTRNITLDVYYCVLLNQLRIRQEFERWLRRTGLIEVYGLLSPEAQRRRVNRFWREYIRRAQRSALEALDRYLTQFFGAIHCALFDYYQPKGEERREEYRLEQEKGVAIGPGIAVYIASYMVYYEDVYKVKGQYCRCDVTGKITRCRDVPPWEYYVLSE